MTDVSPGLMLAVRLSSTTSPEDWMKMCSITKQDVETVAKCYDIPYDIAGPLLQVGWTLREVSGSET
jgi:hypothetical protein